MKKSTKVAFAVVAVGVLIGAAFFASQPREPVYQGRTLRSWLHEFRSGPEPADPNAIYAIRDIGTNGIPVLLAELEYREPRWRKRVRELTEKLPLANLHLEPPWNRALQPAYAFCVLGPQGKPAIPELSRLLFTTRRTTPAAIALAGIGQDALPQFANALSHTNYVIRMAAAAGLRHWHGNTTNVIPLLIEALDDDHQLVRSSAAHTLGRISQDLGLAVPALVRSLDDKMPLVRRSVATVSGTLGRQAEAALPALRKLREDVDPSVAQAAIWAVKEIQRESNDK